jgi:hypothetical protein
VPDIRLNPREKASFADPLLHGARHGRELNKRCDTETAEMRFYVLPRWADVCPKSEADWRVCQHVMLIFSLSVACLHAGKWGTYGAEVFWWKGATLR